MRRVEARQVLPPLLLLFAYGREGVFALLPVRLLLFVAVLTACLRSCVVSFRERLVNLVYSDWPHVRGRPVVRCSRC